MLIFYYLILRIFSGCELLNEKNELNSVCLFKVSSSTRQFYLKGYQVVQFVSIRCQPHSV